MNILRLLTLSLTVALAVVTLGYVNPSFADQPNSDGCGEVHCGHGGGGGDPPPSGAVDINIEYVGWGGRPPHDNHVQMRVQVLVGGQPVEADVAINVDVCPDFMLIDGKCSDESDPDHFEFFGTTSVDDGERFNIQNAPSGCYITTVTGVLIGDDNIVPAPQSDEEFCKDSP